MQSMGFASKQSYGRRAYFKLVMIRFFLRVGRPDRVIDVLHVLADHMPAVGIRKMTEFRGMGTMTAMIMADHREIPGNSCRCKPSVTVGVFAESVENLDDAGRVAFRFPQLHMNIVAVRGGQNLGAVM